MTSEDEDDIVADDDTLLRRIPPAKYLFDSELGTYYFLDTAFENDSDGQPMSAYLRSVMAADGLTDRDVLGPNHRGFGLAELSVRAARNAGQSIALRRPERKQRHRKPRPYDAAHVLVEGKKSPAVAKQLRKAAIWAISPTDLNDLTEKSAISLRETPDLA